MFVRTKPIANSSRKRVQICECYRVGDKVKQRVIKHVGISNNDSHLEELKKLAEAIKAKIKQERESPSLFDLPIPDEVSVPVQTACPSCGCA